MRPEVQKLIDALEAERGESDYRRCRRLITTYYNTIGFDVGDFVFVPRLPSILPSSEKARTPLADDEIALGVVAYSDPVVESGSLFDTKRRPHVRVLLPTGVQEIPKAQVISKAIGLSIETRYDLLIMLDAYLERAEAERAEAEQEVATQQVPEINPTASVRVSCTKCRGTGQVPIPFEYTTITTCDVCGGTGTTTEETRNGK